jgi:hypothetical protein
MAGCDIDIICSTKHRSRCFDITEKQCHAVLNFFNVGHTVLKVPDKGTYQNEHNMLLNFPRCLNIQYSSIANYIVKLTTMH